MLKPAPERTKPGFKTEPRRILVIYENLPAREYALRCHPLPEPDDKPENMEILWISFSALAQSARSAAATRMALVADLIVFVVTPAGDLPQPVKFWMERWIGKRSLREGAIVGLVHRPSTSSELACLKEIYLRHAAHRAGLDYLSYVPRVRPVVLPESPDSYTERAGQTSKILAEILRSIQDGGKLGG
ncbi:MAG: hypothetical protein U1F98_09525 [Verrucomicrobiota bacterium]